MKLRLGMLALILFASFGARAQSITCAQAQAAPSIQLTGSPTCTTTSCTYTDSANILDGSTYGYVVVAVDLAGNACSNYAQNVVIPPTGTHTVALTWNPSPTPSVTYEIFRAPIAGAASGFVAAVN